MRLITGSENTGNTYKNYYLHEIKLFIYVLRYLGLMPIQISKSGKIYFSILSSSFIYSLIVYGAQVYLLAIEMMRTFSQIDLQNASYDGTLSLVFRIIVMSCHFQFGLAYWIQSYKFPGFVNKWLNFQEHYQAVIHKPLLSKIHKIAALYVTGSVVGCAIIVIINSKLNFLLEDVEWSYIIIYYLIFLNVVLTTGFWTFNCYIVYFVGNDFNLNLNEHRPTESKLHTYRILWLELSTVTRSIENAFPLTLILMCMTQAVLFILCCYGGLATLMEHEFSSYTGFLLSIAIIFCMILMTYLPAHKATEEVGTETRGVILSYDLHDMNFKARYEVETFFASIAAVPPTITIAGFSVMDRSTMFAIFINTVTYLIVLIQFRSSK